jgi:Na+/H+ antiporter NhaD/arsenite permease-like protein
MGAGTLFVLTYIGVALGRIPGLALDRTGIALLGAIAMVVGGVLTLEAAVAAVDVPTILLLYALMIVSAQLRLGGFYTRTALRIVRLLDRPRRFLAVSMATAALLSALLANDIVCLAFTPVLARALLRSGRNPLPFLLGLAAASNIGSAATIIGNPQNMLLGQVGGLDFLEFAAWCAPPALGALLAAFGIICGLYRGDLQKAPGRQDGVDPPEVRWPDFDPWQSAKGLAATGLLVVLFLTPIPREIAAVGVAGLLLCSRRMTSRALLGLVDWHLMTLFCALFVVVRGIELAGLPLAAMEGLGRVGVDLRAPGLMVAVATLLSNLVSNVPAVMLLTRFLDPGEPHQWYLLGLSSTFAGNLIVIGSIANLIVIEQARSCGVPISFRAHARVGIPVTLASLAVVLVWVVLKA